MKLINRPDAILFLMAYLSLLGLGALFGGLIVFITIIPAIREMGPFFGSSVAMMTLLGVFAWLLVVPVVAAMIGLWRGKRAGRAITMILVVLAASVSGISAPVLLLLGLHGIALSVPMITAVFLFISSSGALWGLTRPSSLNYFNSRAGRRGQALLLILCLAVTAWLGSALARRTALPAAHAAPTAALGYSSYIGGNGTDEGRSIALDGAGNIYIVGETESDNFLGSSRIISGFSDIFVAKYSPDGRTLLYLSFIGSTDTDTPLAIQVDGQGNAYATALVFNDTFPTKNPLWAVRPHFSHNSVLFKLNGSGGLVYSTYLPLDVFNAHHNLAVDTAGNAYVTGTSSQGDQFNQLSLLKISPGGGQVLLEKYVGGPDSEKGTAVTVDSAGNIYLTGTTEGGDAFPVTANAHQPVCGDIFYNRRAYCFKDGVVVVLNPAGNVTYSSHHGGSFTDDPAAITTDGQGNILVAGNTGSGLFPLAQALQNSCPLDSFSGDCSSPRGFASLIKLGGGTASLTYSTYLGSTESGSNNVVTAASLSSSGQATVVGYSNGRFFPTANPVQGQLSESFCTTFSSQRLCFDAFIATLTPSGGLYFGSYLGATFDDYPYDVALSNGNIWLTGLTEADNFPVTSDAYQKANQVGDDAFLARIGGGSPPPPPGNFHVYLPMIVD